MEKLSRSLLRQIQVPANVTVGPLNLGPEQVLQFGEGNFLRAFVGWLFQQLSLAGKFSGSIVVVQPIAQGMSATINDQQGLYTLLLRGLERGQLVEKREIVTNISRALNAYSQWAEVVAVAESEQLQYIVSNTTEAGIVLDAQDQLAMQPPQSYPAKLTALLYARYQKFQGAVDKGLVIIPCELIENNGKTLRQIVLQLATNWQLPAEFITWLKEANTFVSTLVDRVVTGYPREEAATICESLGYQDDLLVAAELYHLWVIEGPETLAARLPFREIGLNIIWTADQRKYRERKVRILNGAHTTGIPVSYQYGLDTVKEMMDNPVTGNFVRQAIYQEILPALADSDREALDNLAAEVINRFNNPYIKHYLLSILLNSSSKYRARVLPSLLDYQQKYQKLPRRLVFALSCLLNVYSLGEIVQGKLSCKRQETEFVMQDDLATLELFTAIWQEYQQGLPLEQVSAKLLGAVQVWGQDLNKVPHLTEAVSKFLIEIKALGVKAVLDNMQK